YYTNGDLILIGSNLPHCGFTDTNTGNKKETVIQFKPELFGGEFMLLPENKFLLDFFETAKAGLAISATTKKAVGSKIENMFDQEPFQRLISLLEVMKALESAADHKLLNASGFMVELQVQDDDRINMIFNYVKDHFTDEISLEKVAEMSSMTVPSFCRFFKKVTYKTFTRFVNEYRIVHACKLLAEKPMSVANISYESGFHKDRKST